jgi:soluble epoxide hydrolase / lipid-phosphate phosphatase
MTSQGIPEHDFTSTGSTIFYLTAGPEAASLLIFVHDWPDISQTWKPQLIAFASLGFRVIATDTRRYGRTTVSREAHDYTIEYLVAD